MNGSVLNQSRLPVPPVEAVIALSIVFLATEMAKNHRDTLTWRYPISVGRLFDLTPCLFCAKGSIPTRGTIKKYDLRS